MKSCVLLAAFGLIACSGDDGGSQCVTLQKDCQPTYEPTFSNIFERTLLPSCGVPGSACHSQEGHQRGLILDDAEMAYQTLSDGRVIASDPECSLVMHRVSTSNADERMPPGNLPLSAGEQCAIQKWIAGGALR